MRVALGPQAGDILCSHESLLSWGKGRFVSTVQADLEEERQGEGGCQTPPSALGTQPFVSQCPAGGFSLCLPAELGLDSS